MASQPASHPNGRGRTIYLLFNHPIFWLLDGQNMTLLNRRYSNHRLLTLPQCPSPFMLAITKMPTKLPHFPCTLSDYLSHNLGSFQRNNSHLGLVRRHCWSVRYLGCGRLLRAEASLSKFTHQLTVDGILGKHPPIYSPSIPSTV